MIEIKTFETDHGSLYGLYIKDVQIAMAYSISQLELEWNELKQEEIKYHGKTSIGETS